MKKIISRAIFLVYVHAFIRRRFGLHYLRGTEIQCLNDFINNFCDHDGIDVLFINSLNKPRDHPS